MFFSDTFKNSPTEIKKDIRTPFRNVVLRTSLCEPEMVPEGTVVHKVLEKSIFLSDCVYSKQILIKDKEGAAVVRVLMKTKRCNTAITLNS